MTAVLGVLTLNYLFIAPRHQLAIRHTQDLIELVVFLIAAVVVGRLAELGRARAREAESRARLATAREQEATLLAAGGLGDPRRPQLPGAAGGDREARRARRPAPAACGSSPSRCPRPGATSSRSGCKAQQRVWLYVSPDARLAGARSWSGSPSRWASCSTWPRERERVAEQAAETEAARRTETARTAVLHAISHDLRSPLTAITTAVSALRTGQVSERRERRADRRDRRRVGAAGQARRRPARPVQDRGRRGGAAAGLVRPARRRHLGRRPSAGRPSDRARAAARPAARAGRRRPAGARLLQPAGERGQVLAAGRPGARDRRRGGRAG